MIELVRGGFLGRFCNFKLVYIDPIQNGLISDDAYDIEKMVLRSYILYKNLAPVVHVSVIFVFVIGKHRVFSDYLFSVSIA